MKTTFYTVLIVLLIAPRAIAKTVQVGGCLPHLQTYPTISQAVLGVASGSTVLVCPGTYPEQVTIAQPLTLRGVQSGNSANPTITVPAGGLTKTTVAANGSLFYYQILIQSSASPVAISDLGIDGTNNGVPINQGVAGIFYQAASGTVARVAIYNQQGTRGGYGLRLENAGPSPTTVMVQTSSIHDFDAAAISSNGNVTANLKSNDILTSSTLSGSAAPNGIDLFSKGTVSSNRVLTHLQPQGISAGTGISAGSGVVVSNNKVEGFTVGIWPTGTGNTVAFNKVSLAEAAIVVSGSANTIQHNSLLHIIHGGEAIHFNCTGSSNTVNHNIINDSFWGIIDDDGTNIISPNSFSNVTKLISPPC